MANIEEQNSQDFYESLSDNWFIAQPYGFRITLSDNSSYTIFLPISPSNLQIRTNFATNMVPTLYGTVEEHSDVRYFDIAIEGTTGIAPKYSKPYQNGVGFGIPAADTLFGNNPNPGRQSFSITKTIPLGGFFSKTLGALAQAKKQALAVIDGSQKPNEVGLDTSATGYVAFHNLYKMLLRYKRDAAGIPPGGGASLSGFAAQASSSVLSDERKTHPIVFFNYKDGNQYNVVIKDFTMRRSAENPMLYYYSISMRGYKLSPTSGGVNAAEAQAQRLKNLGLDGVEGSLLGDIKQRANSAKGVLGSLAGGINVLGR